MNSTDIVFKLNDTESIKFEGLEFLDPIYPYDEIVIKFYTKDKEYVLGVDFIRHEMAVFYDMLCLALDNRAQLHSSITQNIGFLWNEALQYKTGLVYHKIENINMWVGLDNLVWSTPCDQPTILNAWVYNDSSGAIVLEVTPSYLWDSRETEESNAILYDEWMKSYKPTLVRIVSREVAQEWIKQAEAVLNLIEKSMREFDEANPK